MVADPYQYVQLTLYLASPTHCAFPAAFAVRRTLCFQLPALTETCSRPCGSYRYANQQFFNERAFSDKRPSGTQLRY
jgi:hypothetical protein